MASNPPMVVAMAVTAASASAIFILRIYHKMRMIINIIFFASSRLARDGIGRI
jgi:hypothetical protein